MEIVKGEDALSRIRRNRAFRWSFHKSDGSFYPSRTRNAVFLPQVNPGFAVEARDKIFTVGSCFARHVEAHLEKFGYAFETRNPKFFLADSECTSPSGFFNKFTTPSMLNEVLWASGEQLFPQEGYYRDESGKFHDGQMPAKFSTVERAQEVRESVQQVTRDIFSSDIVIITLGLVEAWHDNETGYYLNIAPPADVVRQHKGRFDLHVLDYGSSLNSLNTLFDLVRGKNPGARFVVTVSPVPLGATFTGKDISLANCYSKAVLRAVAGDFASGKHNVDYFPSYEAVTESTPLGAWMEDGIHVRSELVACVIRHFLRSYLPKEDIARINLDEALSDFTHKLPGWSSSPTAAEI